MDSVAQEHSPQSAAGRLHSMCTGHPKFVLFLIGSAMAGLFSWGVNSWKYSFIGDEYEYYNYALGIIRRHFLVNPFDFDGVFGIERLQSSLWQALFMAIFGETPGVWRVANAVLILPITMLVGLTGIALTRRNLIGFAAAILVGSSATLCGVFKTGYTHPTSLVFFVVSLYFGVRLVLDGSWRHWLWSGIALGLAFFHYIGPIFPLVLCPFHAAALWGRSDRLKKLAALIVPYSLPVIVGVASSRRGAWQPALQKTGAAAEFAGAHQVAVNIGNYFASYVRSSDYMYNHFVEGGYIDRLTLCLLGAGLVWLVSTVKSRVSAAFLSSWILLCVVLGIINPYAYTPSTRSIFLIPHAALAAAFGLAFLTKRLKGNLQRAACLTILSAVVYLNVVESQTGVFERVGNSCQSIVIREAMQVSGTNRKVVAIWKPANFSLVMPQLNWLKNLYGLHDVQLLAIDSTEDLARLSPDDRLLIFLETDFASIPREIPGSLNALAIPRSKYY